MSCKKFLLIGIPVLASILTSVAPPARAGVVEDILNDVRRNAKPLYDYTLGGSVEQQRFGNISAQETAAVRTQYREKSDAELFRRCANMAESMGLMPAGLYPSAYALIVARPADDGQSIDCYKRVPRR